MDQASRRFAASRIGDEGEYVNNVYLSEVRKTVALPKYEKQVKRLLSEDERSAMEANIAGDPLAHPVIPGAGGFRKARWSRGARGKSGGVRAIFTISYPAIRSSSHSYMQRMNWRI